MLRLASHRQRQTNPHTDGNGIDCASRFRATLIDGYQLMFCYFAAHGKAAASTHGIFSSPRQYTPAKKRRPHEGTADSRHAMFRIEPSEAGKQSLGTGSGQGPSLFVAGWNGINRLRHPFRAQGMIKGLAARQSPHTGLKTPQQMIDLRPGWKLIHLRQALSNAAVKTIQEFEW